MYRTKTKSIKALAANSLVEELQAYFVYQLTRLGQERNLPVCFEPVEWFRDSGTHGGGVRFVAQSEALFNRGSVNVSQVHYDDVIEKSLGSATALSTIIHPANPFAPSVHMHISWTEMKNGRGYWRMMADLNPAIVDEVAKDHFLHVLKEAAPAQFDLARAQGDQYFYIPALDRHRGVAHFYLEEFNGVSEQEDFDLARRLGHRVIDCYVQLLNQALNDHPQPSDVDYAQQLAYHSLYLFQVLTLDRGTTSGLLIHDQNDTGIMGSLPARVDKSLIETWKVNMPSPQDQLLEAILDCLPEDDGEITDSVKVKLAQAVRRHYQSHPDALKLQAKGNVIPPTVQNHSVP